ncbi:class I SAM-dependent methyltransferase [Novispirillum itersonii]|uniref:SAM-dependent methyltransferase n=1 Tax=Novispirillum itersonii TaxID=189 RepID=A0A7W9ZHT5_NOVIT|nr:class I SAM-dependent methyltransferase [Novispirillum itersonii]MBB6211731.1 SAM-dependent methyltransferase [Novispirillum itersonii]
MTDTPSCRFCGAPLTQTFVDLGKTPLANSYVAADKAGTPDPVFPLHARVCGSCRLVQVDDVATPEDIFRHYAYFSSYASSWVEHARRFTVAMTERFGLTTASQVVEVASNDGYLLQHFVKQGIPALGIEPALNVAEAARAIGVPTDSVFFGTATARDLVGRGLAADLVVANNVLAHVPDINDFVAGFAILIKPEGVISVEFPHLLRLMEDVQFDTIYHEHFCYLSLYAVEKVFAAHGLRVFDVQELPTHGGSLRILACRAAAAHSEGPGLQKVRADEQAAGLDTDAAYTGFGPKVEAVRDALLAFLHDCKAQGRSVAAYGAAAKGNTLLNYCGVTADLISFVVDRNPHKQGHLLPGSRIPVVGPEVLAERKPDFVLILPWNLTAEIVAQYPEVPGWGGRFAVPVPTLKVL